MDPKLVKTVVYRSRLVRTPDIVRRASALSRVCDATRPNFRFLECAVETHEVERLIALHETGETHPATETTAFVDKYAKFTNT